jgi:hypothetical protein
LVLICNGEGKKEPMNKKIGVLPVCAINERTYKPYPMPGRILR